MLLTLQRTTTEMTEAAKYEITTESVMFSEVKNIQLLSTAVCRPYYYNGC